MKLYDGIEAIGGWPWAEKTTTSPNFNPYRV